MSSIATLLRQGQLALPDSDSPLIDTQILLCHVLEVDRSYLYMSPEELISDVQKNQFLSLINRRHKGQPIAHLTGQRDFWSLNLKVNEHTLIPRPETEHLVEVALAMIQKGQIKNIIDLGTGTGAIALSLASEINKKFPDCLITATDVSNDALAVAKQNLHETKLNNVSFKQGNWFKALERNDKFDLIVSNPPYIVEGHSCLNEGDVQFEPRHALTSGVDGLDAIREIIQHAPTYMNAKAWLMFEHGYDQNIAIQKLFQDRGFTAVETIQDYANLDRVTIGQWTS